MESIPDGIYHKDKNGKYLKCNDTLVNEYYKKKKREEIIGKDIKSISKKSSNRNSLLREKKY